MEQLADSPANLATRSSPVVHAPLFGFIAEQLRTDRRWLVLDLGASRAATVNFLSEFRCRLHVLDLTSSLQQLHEIEAQENFAALERCLDELLPATEPDAPTLVLCWDLLNYLSATMLRSFARLLSARGGGPLLVHALIHYSDRNMPEHPGAWAPKSDSDLRCKPSAPGLREAPRYSPKALEKYLYPLVVSEARLLGNGMQEFLLKAGSQRRS